MNDNETAEWHRDILWALEAGTPIAELTRSTGLSKAQIEALAIEADPNQEAGQ